VNLLDIDTVVLGGIYAPLTPWLAETRGTGGCRAFRDVGLGSGQRAPRSARHDRYSRRSGRLRRPGDSRRPSAWLDLAVVRQ
jgi:hypothetical protein